MSGPEPPRSVVRGRDLLVLFLLGYIGSRIAGIATAALVASGHPLATEPAAIIVGLLFVQNLVLLGATWLVIVRGRAVSWSEIGLRPTSNIWILRGLAIGLLLVPAISLIGMATRSLINEDFVNPQFQALAPAADSLPAAIAVIALAGFLAPLAEEIAFRGVLFQWLRGRMGLWIAALISAFLFGILHEVPELVPAITVMGVVLALVFVRSGSLWPCVVIHATYNTTVALGFFLSAIPRAIS